MFWEAPNLAILFSTYHVRMTCRSGIAYPARHLWTIQFSFLSHEGLSLITGYQVTLLVNGNRWKTEATTAIACLWQGRIVSSTAMGQPQASTPAAVGSASECTPTLRYLARIIHTDILRMVISSHLTRPDHPLQMKAMAPTSGETLQTPVARIVPSIKFSRHRSPTLGKFTASVGLAEHLSFKDQFLRSMVKVHPPTASQAMGARREP